LAFFCFTINEIIICHGRDEGGEFWGLFGESCKYFDVSAVSVTCVCVRERVCVCVRESVCVSV